MKRKKQTAKPLLIAKYHAEALRLVGSVSASQHRFFKVAAMYGKELEPDGLLAGSRA